MTITLDIKPEVEAALARQAAAQHLDVAEYAMSLLEEAAKLAVVPAAGQLGHDAKDMLELFAPLRGLNLEFERDRDSGRDITL